MLMLALLFLVVLLLPLVVRLPRRVDLALDALNGAIWVTFTVDYLVRLYLARDRWRFVRAHPLDLLVVVVPFLRPLAAARAAQLARLGAVAGVAHRRALRSFHATVAGFAAVSAAGLLVLAAAVMYDTEKGVDGANIRTFGDALWWAATTVTTVGYGDRYPTTGTGRLVAGGLMVVGIALLGVVTATIAAWFVDRLRRLQEAEEEAEVTLTDVLEELRAIRTRLDALEAPRGDR
jgi:voltage-gated potassium channel